MLFFRARFVFSNDPLRIADLVLLFPVLLVQLFLVFTLQSSGSPHLEKSLDFHKEIKGITSCKENTSLHLSRVLRFSSSPKRKTGDATTLFYHAAFSMHEFGHGSLTAFHLLPELRCNFVFNLHFDFSRINYPFIPRASSQLMVLRR